MAEPRRTSHRKRERDVVISTEESSSSENENFAAPTSQVTSRGCCRGFILCVLLRALIHVCDQFSKKKLCSFPFDSATVQTWLDTALNDCENEIEFQKGLGGTLLDADNSSTYWTTPRQFFTWWKNNVERKAKHMILIRDASYHGDVESLVQRARYCQNAVALSINVKSYFERNIVVHGEVPCIPLSYQMPRHMMEILAEMQGKGLLSTVIDNVEQLENQDDKAATIAQIRAPISTTKLEPLESPDDANGKASHPSLLPSHLTVAFKRAKRGANKHGNIGSRPRGRPKGSSTRVIGQGRYHRNTRSQSEDIVFADHNFDIANACGISSYMDCDPLFSDWEHSSSDSLKVSFDEAGQYSLDDGTLHEFHVLGSEDDSWFSICSNKSSEAFKGLQMECDNELAPGHSKISSEPDAAIEPTTENNKLKDPGGNKRSISKYDLRNNRPNNDNSEKIVFQSVRNTLPKLKSKLLSRSLSEYLISNIEEAAPLTTDFLFDSIACPK